MLNKGNDDVLLGLTSRLKDLELKKKELDRKISLVIDQIIEFKVGNSSSTGPASSYGSADDDYRAESENEAGFLVGDRVTEKLVKPWKKPKVGTITKITKCFVYVKVDGDKSLEAGQKRKHNSYWKLIK